MYDYLIVGSGFFGSIFACEAKKRGKKCLVIDKRRHIGGNCYTEKIEGIQVHKYGAHIFHTSKKEIWDYLNQFISFNNFINAPIAKYNDETYNLPFNMNTFSKLWGISTPQEAKDIIERQRSVLNGKEPSNLEEQAISLVGTDIYEKLIKGYTQKQWGMHCRKLPAFIIKRLPVRFTYDNNYFKDRYQGIPEGGYTQIFEQLLEGIEVKLNYDYFDHLDDLNGTYKKLVYTGPIDQLFDYQYGPLLFRGLRFDNELLEEENHQGNAVVNYTDADTPYTRIIEHKHFEFGTQPKTVITKEYPIDWRVGAEPYYTVNDAENTELYQRYRHLASEQEHMILGGRLAEYKYYDMDQVIESALNTVKEEFADAKQCT